MDNDVFKNLATAKKYSKKLAASSLKDRNNALFLIKEEILSSTLDIIKANELDIAEGKKNNLSEALLDRLLLTEKRIKGMVAGIEKILAQPDPIGKTLSKWNHGKGMEIEKVAVPLGLICVIYEARPNVTTDAVALAIKSGNAIILRGSQHAYNSNFEIVLAIKKALEKSKISSEVVQFINSKDRAETLKILSAKEYVDLVIPRGGEELKDFVLKNSKIPIIGAGGGLCHLYIDEYADKNKAINIALNAKTQRPGVCNAVETILVHEKIAQSIFPELEKKLIEKNVEIVVCEKSNQILNKCLLAAESDWQTEYLDLKISIKTVNSIEEAIDHINKYGTLHSETIVTENLERAKQFQSEIDAACVYVNASTRFTDGEEFGFGAEIGISTQKLHARGPIGLQQLTTYKYLITGSGQIRD